MADEQKIHPSNPDAEPRDAAGAEAARSAGRGGLAIAAAKIYFMVTGLVQQIALGNILVGGGYGALSTVMGIASISYNPLIQTGIQGVSRPVAPASPEERPAVIRTALKVHFSLGLLAAALFLGLAPVVARATNAPYLTTTFRLFSLVLLAYGLYGPLIGILNGRQKFLHQAGLDVIAATLRTICMVGGAWWFAKNLGLGDRGAAIGFAASAAMMFFIASVMTGYGRAGKSSLAAREHLTFIGPLLLGQFILNLLFQADLQLLGAFARDAAVGAGRSAQAADPLVGAYRASQLFGFLPYQLLIAVSFVLFPMLAKAYKENDRRGVGEYVRTGVRIALILAGLAVSISSGLSEQLLRLVFPTQPFDAIGGPAMRVLAIGLGAFAIFGILITVLNSLERERAAMGLTAAAFALIVVLCAVFVRGEPFDRALLLRTATATAIGHVVATLAAAALVKRTAGGVVRLFSVVRVLGAFAVATTMARYLPEAGKLATLAYCGIVAVVYLGVLVVTREVGKQDLDDLLRIVARRRKTS